MRSFFSIVPLILSCLVCSPAVAQHLTIETDYVRIEADDTGRIRGVADKTSNRQYLPAGEPAYLISLYKDSSYIRPKHAAYSEADGNIRVTFTDQTVAVIQMENKQRYLRLELLSVKPSADVEAVVWGPYPTTIDHLIGETVGVVRDTAFAIGMQALHINTIEGLPEDGDNVGGGYYIDPLPGQQLPEGMEHRIGEQVSINVNREGDIPEYVRIYRGSLAVKKPYGSQLRLFARNRTIPRTIGPADNRQYIPAIDSDFIGSAIAFFGCPESRVLDVIEAVALEEGLPYPVFDGQWIKRSPRVSDAYMMYEGGNFAKALEYAEAGNFRLIHIGDVFQTWGHFGLQTGRFPNGASDIRKFTARAREAGISIGVHTLTNFTGTNDAYVSPIPSDSLSITGSAILTKALNEEDEVVYVDDPVWFKNLGGTRTVKIGKELLGYKAVSADKPWRLEGVVRGQFGTAKAAHPAGARVDKLANNVYRGFLPDLDLQQVYAKRLAEVCNETGIDLMDFDGYEGLETTGHGTYGQNKFIDTWYRSLDRDRLVCGSRTSHYFWHVYAFMNWGEPWYSGLRESQVNYRIENQRYFERNYMPGMLGWFKLEARYRPEEIEWIQARSVAFDAGYLLRVDESIEQSGFKAQFFESIREWQRARRLGAFKESHIQAFKNPKNEFHLKKVSEHRWDLYPVKLDANHVHQYRMVQTGEPISSEFEVHNPHEGSAMQFYAEAVAVGGNTTETLGNLQIEVNGYQTLVINAPIKAGDKLMADGQGVYRCDSYWNKLEKLPVNAVPQWREGTNTVVVTSEFSSDEAPSLTFDFKFVGPPERVAATKIGE